MSAAHRKRARADRADWLAHPERQPGRPEEAEAEKERAERVMAEFEARAAVVGYARARLAPSELVAGPLRTDNWRIAPDMRGIGRRLGSLSTHELEAEEQE